LCTKALCRVPSYRSVHPTDGWLHKRGGKTLPSKCRVKTISWGGFIIYRKQNPFKRYYLYDFTRTAERQPSEVNRILQDTRSAQKDCRLQACIERATLKGLSAPATKKGDFNGCVRTVSIAHKGGQVSKA